MTPLIFKTTFKALVVGAICVSQAAYACTGISLTGADGTEVRARTMEWSTFDLQNSITLIPEGFEMASIMEDGSEGATWTAQYDVVAVTGLGRLVATDGMNSAGLSGGLFYLPGFAEYPDYDPEVTDVSLAPGDVLTYALSRFATVAEVKEAMADARIVNVVDESLGFAAPVHFYLSDPTGARLVIEVVDQEMKLYDAALGVITNSPSYDWHLTNLRNYLNLSATAMPTRTVEDTDFSPIGAGSGMLGLPGDHTPPSRFVRAVAFSQSARETTGGYDTVRESFRVLDNFNVPVHGVAHDADSEGDLVLSATQYTAAADMTNLKFYYHTQFNRRVRMIDLNEVDFDALNGEAMTVPMDDTRDEDIETVTFG
ncbi:MAG: choloylglycine hydrolase family protein [Pseudomonadota bacterium]